MAFYWLPFVMKKFSSLPTIAQAMGSRWRIPSKILLQSLSCIYSSCIYSVVQSPSIKLLWPKAYSPPGALWLPQALPLGVAVSTEVPQLDLQLWHEHPDLGRIVQGNHTGELARMPLLSPHSWGVGNKPTARMLVPKGWKAGLSQVIENFQLPWYRAGSKVMEAGTLLFSPSKTLICFKKSLERKDTNLT